MWWISIHLWMLNYPRIPVLNPAWSWCLILFMYCWIYFANVFVEHFMPMFNQWYWPVICFFVVSWSVFGIRLWCWPHSLRPASPEYKEGMHQKATNQTSCFRCKVAFSCSFIRNIFLCLLILPHSLCLFLCIGLLVTFHSLRKCPGRRCPVRLYSTLPSGNWLYML